MLSGPIDYRYNEKMMGLVKNKFLDAESLKNQQFDHEQHLYIKHIEIEGKQNGYSIEDCGSTQMRGLVADHGLYAVVGLFPTEKIHSNRLSKIYYEPYGVNEHLVWGYH
ncbi:hypothetical protein B9Z55_027061 [Caenorhabditis nigoni]|nr:hypothetical protein B9Z55_027061 [Caenorhabditis nigoni]